MNKTTATNNNDNGLVDMTQEAILSGATASTPEAICTKYPEKCTSLETAKDDCKTNCCTDNRANECGTTIPLQSANSVTTYTQPGLAEVHFESVVTNTGEVPLVGAVIDLLYPALSFISTTSGVLAGNALTVDLLPGESVTITSVSTSLNTGTYTGAAVLTNYQASTTSATATVAPLQV